MELYGLATRLLVGFCRSLVTASLDETTLPRIEDFAKQEVGKAKYKDINAENRYLGGSGLLKFHMRSSENWENCMQRLCFRVRASSAPILKKVPPCFDFLTLAWFCLKTFFS